MRSSVAYVCATVLAGTILYFLSLDIRKLPSTSGSYKPPSRDPIFQASAHLSSDKVKAAFVILARNSDLGAILTSIHAVEDRFNKKFHYPYVFLNDEPFSKEFIASTSALISSNASYGLVPRDHWEEPPWIDESKAEAGRNLLVSQEVLYADSISYRRMCRYQSGFFFRHNLLDEYDWCMDWRIEPNVRYFCDLDYDPFKYMQDNKKSYGWTVSIYEYKETITTLWETTKNFMKEYPQHIAKDNSMYFISNDKGETYNLCHFWSNFEIGSLKFLRSQAYTDYFDYLDRAGGFSYERWGDAPVHSIAAALFLPADQIHFFSDIGYRHEPFQHCPTTAIKQGCSCDPSDSFSTHWYSCTPRCMSSLFAFHAEPQRESQTFVYKGKKWRRIED